MAFFPIEIKPYGLVVIGLDASGTTQKYFFSNYGHTNVDGNIVGVTPDYMEPRINSIVYQGSMFSQNRLRGPMPINTAAIELENSDGALDTLRSISFDGQDAQVWDLNPASNMVGRSPSSFKRLTPEQPIFAENTVAFSFRDKRYDYSRQMATRRFLGTNTGGNGIEGTASDIKDQLFPLVYGTVRNISLILVNAQKLIYCIGIGSDPATGGALLTGWTLQPYDMGVTLTADSAGNYSSQADMEANAPAPGKYRVWTSGYLRLGSTPAGKVTADLNNPIGGSSTISAVMGKFNNFAITAAGGFGGIPTFVNLLSADPVCGLYLNTETVVLDAMSTVLASVNGYLNRGPDPASNTSNSAHICQLCLPTALPYTPFADRKILLTEGMILDPGLKQVVAEEDERGNPIWKVTVRYSRNYTVMSDDEIAGSVVDPFRSALKQPYLTASQSDISVLTQWPNAIEITVDSVLANQSDASAEATRLLNLLKVRRDMFSLTIPKSVIFLQSFIAPEHVQPGLRVFITHHRFGLSGGKFFLLMGVDQNIDTVTLTVWG